MLDRLAAAYARAARNYVAASYSAYVLARLSIEAAPAARAARAGADRDHRAAGRAALGVLLVAAELRLEARPSTAEPQTPRDQDGTLCPPA